MVALLTRRGRRSLVSLIFFSAREVIWLLLFLNRLSFVAGEFCLAPLVGQRYAELMFEVLVLLTRHRRELEAGRIEAMLTEKNACERVGRRTALRNAVNAGLGVLAHLGLGAGYGANSFLKNASADDLGGESSSTGLATEKASLVDGIGLGFGTYGMKGLPVLEAIKQTGRIGYRGLEFCLIDGWPTSIPALTTVGISTVNGALGASDLVVPSLLESLPCLGGRERHEENLRRLRAATSFAKQLNQPVPPVVQSIVGGRSGDWERSKDQLVSELRGWAEVAEQSGVLICFKPHASHLVSRPEQAIWVIEQVGSERLRLVYDYSHYFLEGLGLEESLDALLPATPYIQVKDSRGELGKHQYLLPGDGETDYALMFTHLYKKGYHGFVNVEVSSMIHRQTGYDPIASAEICFARLDPIMQRARDAAQ